MSVQSQQPAGTRIAEGRAVICSVLNAFAMPVPEPDHQFTEEL